MKTWTKISEANFNHATTHPYRHMALAIGLFVIGYGLICKFVLWMSEQTIKNYRLPVRH